MVTRSMQTFAFLRMGIFFFLLLIDKRNILFIL